MKKIVLPILLAVLMIAAALTASAQETFTDVPDGSWYHDAVYYCVENKLFAGVTDTTFAPNTGMTRAMFVTVLASQHEIDRDAYKTSSFTDVASGKWYSVNVEWAYKEGLVAGVGGGKFAPDQVITRAQLVTLIRTYAEYLGHDMTVGEDLDLSSYKDAKDVPAWARDGFKWAVANDIVGGVKSGSDTLLAPGTTATRATVAQIMMKLCQLPVEKTVEPGEAKMTIGGNDISLYTIIKPAAPASRAKIDNAASKLQEFIETATGVTLPIATDDTAESDYEIIVGDSDREGKPETDYTNVADVVPDLGFTVSVKGSKMYFTGAVDAYKRFGTFYSTYFFAEKELGFKFYQDDCIVCAPKETIDLADGYEYIDGPAFEERSLYMEGAWEHCFISDDYYSGSSMVHNQGAWIEPGSQPNAAMPCLSNEDNLQKLIGGAVATLTSNTSANAIWVSINDSGSYCECEKCMSLYREYGSRAATLILACNRVSEALQKTFPERDIVIYTIAYNYVTMPVKSTLKADHVVVYYCTIYNCPSHAYNDPTCPYNHYVTEHIQKWKDVCRKVYVWDYAADFSYCMIPFANFYSMPGSIAAIYDNGARGMFINAVDKHTGEFNELRGYLYIKLMRYPHMTEKEYFGEMNGFIKAFYGDEKLYLRKYIDIIEELTNDRHFGYNGKTDHVFDYAQVRERVDEIDELWAKAAKEAKGNPLYEMRVDRARMSWLYLKQCATYETKFVNGTPEEKAAYIALNKELYWKMAPSDYDDPSNPYLPNTYNIVFNEGGKYEIVKNDAERSPEEW